MLIKRGKNSVIIILEQGVEISCDLFFLWFDRKIVSLWSKSTTLRMNLKQLFVSLIACMALMGCMQNRSKNSTDAQIVFEQGSYPHAIFWQGKYYYTMQLTHTDNIILYSSPNLSDIQSGQKRTVWQVDSMQHIWSPEIHRINSKWYLYFEADDGNTDNHQLYVLENTSDDPMKGDFLMKGVIKTNDEWNFGLHPTSINVRGQQYLLWSGWQHRRMEAETQCIYIARMENPWTLSSQRVMISQPEYEWERQWINPDGNRSAYPIYVNENPEAFLSPDSQEVIVLYSASGIWTVYTALGMLTAPVTANLLDSASWTKNPEPVLMPDVDAQTSISNVYLVPSTDGQSSLLLYEYKRIEQGNIVRDTYLRTLPAASPLMLGQQ